MTRDRLGRIALWLLAAFTLIAFADGLRRMGIAGPGRIWVETWRTFAFVVFAGLFAILALRPRVSPGVWELALGHKIALVLFGLTLGDVAEAHVAIVADVIVVVLVTFGWWACRGWQSWSGPLSVSGGR